CRVAEAIPSQHSPCSLVWESFYDTLSQHQRRVFELRKCSQPALAESTERAKPWYLGEGD
ncbi:hypothetical protein, partial [Halorubellus sp. PRR65]|uniref:hypothetical protein n=1 Tax=Halorubellus sp. PRR65 TaxID=3098148 RepID=UPI002B25F8A9